MAQCKFCGTDITWMKDGRKNVPVEIDGAKHECENFKNARSSYREIKPNEIDPDILKEYQDRMNNQIKKK